MSDAWESLQAVKSSASSLREKMRQRKKDRAAMAAELAADTVTVSTDTHTRDTVSVTVASVTASTSATVTADVPSVVTSSTTTTDSTATTASVKLSPVSVSPSKAGDIVAVIEKKLPSDAQDERKRKHKNSEGDVSAKQQKVEPAAAKAEFSIESLLTTQSAKEREEKKVNEEILDLLSKPTAKEEYLVDKFRSRGGAQLQEFCQYGTRDECSKCLGTDTPCKKLHFRKIIHKHTDESLGDCSFLNTCFHMDSCKYVHYEIDYPAIKTDTALLKKDSSLATVGHASDTYLYPPQWIQCDLRIFNMAVLGKCAVVMADPPWDIHMELPYGTMSDDEMRRLDIPGLQDDGFIFLWVTGRAMELGRECLDLWGYKRCDEVIWVKTNQLQRIIRTGRTGHWLNHGKEHCLVGVKGNPKGVNKGLDCDVIVAEVRATSHKPDEIYGIIERLSPGTRKCELFGRPHNVQPNWITLGNQVEGVRLEDPVVVKNFREHYKDGNCMAPSTTR